MSFPVLMLSFVEVVLTFHQTSLLTLDSIPLISQTIVNTASSLHEAAHETYLTTLKLLHIRMCACVLVSLCSVIKTQMNTNYTIYTASLLYDIVYYIYFSYRINVVFCWMLPLKGQIIPVKDDDLSVSVLIFLIN